MFLNINVIDIYIVDVPQTVQRAHLDEIRAAGRITLLLDGDLPHQAHGEWGLA